MCEGDKILGCHERPPYDLARVEWPEAHPKHPAAVFGELAARIVDASDFGNQQNLATQSSYSLIQLAILTDYKLFIVKANFVKQLSMEASAPYRIYPTG